MDAFIQDNPLFVCVVLLLVVGVFFACYLLGGFDGRNDGWDSGDSWDRDCGDRGLVASSTTRKPRCGGILVLGHLQGIDQESRFHHCHRLPGQLHTVTDDSGVHDTAAW